MHLRHPLLPAMRSLTTNHYSRLFSHNIPSKLISVFNNKSLQGESMVLHGNGGRDKGIKFLVENKVNLNMPDSEGNTPLMLAASKGYAEVCDYLLKMGADHKLKNKKGQNALHIAISNEHANVVYRLLAYGVDINEKFNDKTPLQLASGPAKLAIYTQLEKQSSLKTRMAIL